MPDFDRTTKSQTLGATEWAGLGLVLLGAIIVLLNLTTRSLWWDELFTMALASSETSTSDAAAQIGWDVHPPVYFWAARIWMVVLSSSSDFTLRLFNFVPYGIALYAAIRTIRRRQDTTLMLWSILFFTSFGTLWYLQEARMYAMVIASAFIACLVVMEFRQQAEERLSAGFAILTSIGFVILPLGHWFSLAFSGLILIGLCLWSLQRGARIYLILFLLQGIVLGLAGVIWIGLNLENTLGGVGSYGEHIYGGEISPWGVRLSFTGILLYGLTLNPILIASAVYGLVHLVRSKQRLPEFVIILIVSGVLFLSIYAVSVFSPMYQPRNFTWLVPVLTLLAALGLQGVFDRLDLSAMKRAGGLVILSAMSAVIGWVFITVDGAGKVFRLEQDSWRSAGEYVSNRPDCLNRSVPVSAQWLTAAHTPDSVAWKFTEKLYGFYVDDRIAIRNVVPGVDTVQVGQSSCPVILWIGQVGDAEAQSIATQVIGSDYESLTEPVLYQGHVILMARGTDQAE